MSEETILDQSISDRIILIQSSTSMSDTVLTQPPNRKTEGLMIVTEYHGGKHNWGACLNKVTYVLGIPSTASECLRIVVEGKSLVHKSAV